MNYFKIFSTGSAILKGLSVGGISSPSGHVPLEFGSEGNWAYCNHFGVNAIGDEILLANIGVTLGQGEAPDGGILGTNGDGINDVAERNVIYGDSESININFGRNLIISGNYIGITANGLNQIGIPAD